MEDFFHSARAVVSEAKSEVTGLTEVEPINEDYLTRVTNRKREQLRPEEPKDLDFEVNVIKKIFLCAIQLYIKTNFIYDHIIPYGIQTAIVQWTYILYCFPDVSSLRTNMRQTFTISCNVICKYLHLHFLCFQLPHWWYLYHSIVEEGVNIYETRSSEKCR